MRKLLPLLLFFSLLAAPALADDLADFHAAVERAMVHHRGALGYLRTGNVDLAVLELERMNEAWNGLVTRFGKTPPVELAGNTRYVGTLTDVSTRIVGAFIVIDLGRLDVARASLTTIRHALAAMRRESKVEVLADCVLAANTAMDDFFTLRDSPPDWADADARKDVAGKAAAYATALRRCDGMAPASVKADLEFRRLIDGALASLAQVAKAIETRDNGLLVRLLIELRSFDNLLAFRFG